MFNKILYAPIWDAPIWNVMAAIGTICAVIVSLYLANREKKIVRKLYIGQQIKELYEQGAISLIVTIENIGNVPIILNSYGRRWSKGSSEDIMTDINKFLSDKEEYILLKPNDAKVIEYKHSFNRTFREGDSTIYNTYEYKLFYNAIFIAKDTYGNSYPKL